MYKNGFKTSDDKVFFLEQDATVHQKMVDYETDLMDLINKNSKSIMCSGDVFNFINENAKEIYYLLKKSGLYL